MPLSTLIIACGNSIRGDDRAGGLVADRVERAGLPGVDVLRVHQLTPELAESVAGAQRAVVVDAGVGKRSAFRRVKARAGTALTHYLTAETLVGLVERLYGAAPEVYLLTVPGCSFGLSEKMSDGADRAATRAARRLINFLKEKMG
jgi:hydrogenase maturation protease